MSRSQGLFTRGDVSPPVCQAPAECNYKCAKAYTLTQAWNPVSQQCTWTALPSVQSAGCICSPLLGVAGSTLQSTGDSSSAAARWEGAEWGSSLFIEANVQGQQCKSVYTAATAGASTGGGGGATSATEAPPTPTFPAACTAATPANKLIGNPTGVRALLQ